MIDSDGSGTIEAAESFGRIKLRRFGSHRMEMLKYPSGAVDVSNVVIFGLFWHGFLWAWYVMIIY
jgi:hypothetical protein